MVDNGVQHRKWGGNTYPGKKKLLFEIKKGKLKTKKLVQIIKLDEQELSIQSVDRTKAVEVLSWWNICFAKKTGK